MKEYYEAQSANMQQRQRFSSLANKNNVYEK